MKYAAARLLLAYGSVFGALLILLSFSSGDAAAEGVAGTWVSTVAGEGFFDHTYPADFHYDVNLELDAGGSGIEKATCSKVDINVAGWESARQAVGKVTTNRVTGTYSNGKYTMSHSGASFPLTVSGGRMYGSGEFTDSSGTTNSWKYDLKGGSGAAALGDMAVVSAASAAVAGIGAAAGLAASMVPAPKPIPPRPGAPTQHPGLRSGSPPVIRSDPFQRGQGPIYAPSNPPPVTYQPPVSYSPGDARTYEPQPFNPPTPDPNLTQSLGGTGVFQGPPDTPPPPNPPRGDERPEDNNPTCPRCHNKTMPTPTRTAAGYRWYCRFCGNLPWG